MRRGARGFGGERGDTLGRKKCFWKNSVDLPLEKAATTPVSCRLLTYLLTMIEVKQEKVKDNDALALVIIKIKDTPIITHHLFLLLQHALCNTLKIALTDGSQHIAVVENPPVSQLPFYPLGQHWHTESTSRPARDTIHYVSYLKPIPSTSFYPQHSCSMVSDEGGATNPAAAQRRRPPNYFFRTESSSAAGASPTPKIDQPIVR